MNPRKKMMEKVWLDCWVYAEVECNAVTKNSLIRHRFPAWMKVLIVNPRDLTREWVLRVENLHIYWTP